MNEQEKKPTHYTTGENGEAVPVYPETAAKKSETAESKTDSAPLYYVTEPSGEVKPVGVDTEIENEAQEENEPEKLSVNNVTETADIAENTAEDTTDNSEISESEEKLNEDKTGSAEISQPEEEAVVDDNPKKEESDANIENSVQEDSNKPTEEDLQKVDLKLDQNQEDPNQEQQEVKAATTLVNVKDEKNKTKMKPWQKLGAGIAAVATVGGALFGVSKVMDSSEKDSTSTSVQIEDLSPEQKLALEQEGKKIISDLDAVAEVWVKNIEDSDKAQWDEAFALSSTNPEQAGKILTNASVSKQLIDLAVSLNEGVWTEDYKNVMEKLLYQSSGKKVSLDTTASDVKNYLIKSGVWEYLPGKCTLQTTTIDTMFQTLNSTGDFLFGVRGNDGVKQDLINLQQTNINFSSYHIESGALSQDEVNALIKGSEKYIENVNTNLDKIMQ